MVEAPRVGWWVEEGNGVEEGGEKKKSREVVVGKEVKERWRVKEFTMERWRKDAWSGGKR